MELSDEPTLGSPWEKYDDYYVYRAIDAKTYAIMEPRYYQKNVSYLILGDAQAILFDSGPGIRNIKPLVETLTDPAVDRLCISFAL